LPESEALAQALPREVELAAELLEARAVKQPEPAEEQQEAAPMGLMVVA